MTAHPPARATEQGLSRARRARLGHTARSAGWARFAKTLGVALDPCRDPAQRFGPPQRQALRAARLVAAPMLHAVGSTRCQALDCGPIAIRRIHDAVLDQGTLPLGTLGRLVDAWIEAEAARPAPAATEADSTGHAARAR